MKQALPLLTLFAGFLLSGPAARAEQPAAGKQCDSGKTYEVREVRDLAYVEGKDADAGSHKLDIYVPQGKKEFPVLVFAHGGCWSFGDKSGANLYPAFARTLAAQGVVVVLPNYRLSPWVKHPAHVKDLARAVAWTKKNAAKYGGDPKQLFVGGHSAGGHLAALLATNEEYLKAEGLSRKDVRGVVAVSGVYRIPDKVEFTWPNTGEKISLQGNPFNYVFGSDPKAREAASPITHVCAGLPPFLLLYADMDLPLIPEMTRDFAAALKDKKCDVDSKKVAGRNHNNIVFSAKQADDPVIRALVEFIDRHGA
jgi:acetyl esterase/lipase